MNLTLITIPTYDLRAGDKIWEGPAWSSHGMKGGLWDIVTAEDIKDMQSLIAYYGETVDIAVRP